MEAVICRAGNIAISCSVIRGEGSVSSTQEKEKTAKLPEKARLAEKSAPSAATISTGAGRSFTSTTHSHLPFPPQKSFIRFLWFSNSGKADERGSDSGGSQDGKTKEDYSQNKHVAEAETNITLVSCERQKEAITSEGEDGSPLHKQEEDLSSIDFANSATAAMLDTMGEGSAADLQGLENGNAAKRWIQSLLKGNFLKRSPRLAVKVPASKEADVTIEKETADAFLESATTVEKSEGLDLTYASEDAKIGTDNGVTRCFGCETELVSSCAENNNASPLSTLEVAHLNVPHDLESFSKFLHDVPLSELKVIHQGIYLSNLAYSIPKIQAGELARIHRLVFVSSSVELKAKALAEEKAAAAATDEKNGQDGEGEDRKKFYISPASAYALAAAASSFLRSEKKKSKQVEKNSDKGRKSGDKSLPGNSPSDEEILDSLDAEAEVEKVQFDKSKQVEDEMTDLPSFMRPVTSVVTAQKETKQAMSKDLRSLHTCPCDWFAVDHKGGPVRIFSVQGSESFASWQANLLFEPIEFENAGLGVMVHRGIYEAALGLYEQCLPFVLDHLKLHGEKARIRFVGHSLGGSLGLLLSLMLLIRGVVQAKNLLPVYMFGSPFILCGGDYLLKRLGLPQNHVRSVMMHRDIVPRSFACNYPDHVAEVLRRVNGTFREYSCLARQRLLYAPMGQMMILQPEEAMTSYHPLLPSGSGLYVVRHRSNNEVNETDGSCSSRAVEVRAAQRSFLNQPHPLEILSDPGAYGPEGSIAKHHDPRCYRRAVEMVLRSESRRWRRIERERRRQFLAFNSSRNSQSRRKRSPVGADGGQENL